MFMDTENTGIGFFVFCFLKINHKGDINTSKEGILNLFLSEIRTRLSNLKEIQSQSYKG